MAPHIKTKPNHAQSDAEAKRPPISQDQAPDDLQDSELTVRKILQVAFGDARGANDDAFIRAGMSIPELVRLYELVRRYRCCSALEVGMAAGTSSVVICAALRENGNGSLTSIDPYQSSPEGYAGAGTRHLHKAKLDHLHRLVEQPDYVALPALLNEGRLYDLVLVDGWHSFDYTMLDLFYADVLLKDGGILAIHDTTAPAVHKAVRFLETHKPYEPVSPPIMIEINWFPGRLWRRVCTHLNGPKALAQARSRREEWRMLAAYRKLATRQAPEDLHKSF